MLTTERKIEIATILINDETLGSSNLSFEDFVPYGICEVLRFHVEEEEHDYFRKKLREFGSLINISTPCGQYWFSLKENLARTERIEFLKKYIEHLKDQEPPMMGMSY